ncbi:reverse transcriptase domain-containing protein [Tanacetum coccineum]
MAEEDEEKTAFITNQGIFCYTKMPFGLRNAGATYQWLVDKTFHGQIGRNLEVYVDDLVIKSRTEDEVNTKGIRICPDKVDVVLSLQSPKCLKDMQKLNEKLASSNRFLAKSAKKSLPFFKTLKKCIKKSDFLWTEEVEAAFRQIKKHIAKLPMLTALDEQEELIVYGSIQGGGQRRTNDGKRSQADANLLCQPGAKGPESKLHCLCKLTDPEGVEFTYALRFQFEATNNEAEYEALIAGLRIAEKIGVQNLEVNVDSKLVAKQVNGTYIAKETDMVKYLEKVKVLSSTFRAFSIKQVPRSKNKKADALSKMASTSFAHLSKQVLVEELKEKSVNKREVLAVVEEEGDTWMTPIHEYLTDEILPAERKKARAIKRKSQRFAIINGILYKKSFLGLWLRCVGPSQENYVLREIHKGSCSMHAGTQSVVAKALMTGYYWPTMHKDARALIKACQECQTNGLVERANRSLGEGIKARLGKDNKNWLEEISHVLWAHRTMVKSSNGDTPFSLTYGTEAVIPAEIGMPTFRTAEVDVAENDEALEINLELLEEKREQAAIREAKSKRQMEKYYNTKVRNTSFKIGDLVYRSNEASRVEDTGKLGPKWEGPYEVTEALGKGSYKLKDRNGRELPRTWNVCNLKKCYIHKV